MRAPHFLSSVIESNPSSASSSTPTPKSVTCIRKKVIRELWEFFFFWFVQNLVDETSLTNTQLQDGKRVLLRGGATQYQVQPSHFLLQYC
ncbi:hypothetical protein DVH24_007388 [Malus domestica]|uniref:Uncharacterized protein n=1 Tax=Malus domestica TaxID=3750 RepID=A0A498HJQ5_MALDO|nr:hypothetical protein DVH24_007388 [Malus domestica]